MMTYRTQTWSLTKGVLRKRLGMWGSTEEPRTPIFPGELRNNWQGHFIRRRDDLWILKVERGWAAYKVVQ